MSLAPSVSLDLVLRFKILRQRFSLTKALQPLLLRPHALKKVVHERIGVAGLRKEVFVCRLMLPILCLDPVKDSTHGPESSLNLGPTHARKGIRRGTQCEGEIPVEVPMTPSRRAFAGPIGGLN